MNKTIKTLFILSLITATCWAYLLGEYIGSALSQASYEGGHIAVPSFTHSSSTTGSVTTGSTTTEKSFVDEAMEAARQMLDSGGGTNGGVTTGGTTTGGTTGVTTSRTTTTTSLTQGVDVSALAEYGTVDEIVAALNQSGGGTAEDYQRIAQALSNEALTTGGGETTSTTGPEVTTNYWKQATLTMDPIELALFESNGDAAWPDYDWRSDSACKEILAKAYLNQSDWLGGECPLLSSDIGEAEQQLWGEWEYEPTMAEQYTSGMSSVEKIVNLDTEVERYKENNPLLVNELGEEADEVIENTVAAWQMVHSGWLDSNCPMLEFADSFGETPDDYALYFAGYGPMPEGLRIYLEEGEEAVWEKSAGGTSDPLEEEADRIAGDLGLGASDSEAQGRVAEALALAVIDKAVADGESDYREIINSLDSDDVKTYESKINEVSDSFDLNYNEAVSVLAKYTTTKKTTNPTYTLLQDRNIIQSISENDETSKYIASIQNLKETMGATVSGEAADINCDSKVNLTDSAILMSFWGKDPSQFNSCQSPDINKDGSVNLTDFSIMMSYWS